MLQFIQRQETDPYYNLAAEEYFLKSASEDTFMTWRNEPSVIIGKHQNALKEVNPGFVEKHNLPVIRRISGGGTVYHDLGIINYSFIFTNRKENLIDFKEFTKPIIIFLQRLGLEASFEGKNNITVKGFKVSGNSAHLYKNKVLFHGTLLFDANLQMLNQSISGNESLYQDNAVKSIRANVLNIKDLLISKISSEEFLHLFQDFISKYFDGKAERLTCDEENAAILQLAEEKYRTHQWNYGYSPDYEFHNKWIYNNVEFSIHLFVKEGTIFKVKLSGPVSISRLLTNLEARLQGKLHQKTSIYALLSDISITTKEESDFLNQFLSKLL